MCLNAAARPRLVAAARAAPGDRATCSETLTRAAAAHRRGYALRLDVEDHGHAGTVVPHAPDSGTGGGYGLNLVQALSERWGTERVAVGGTRVRAQLALAPRPSYRLVEQKDLGGGVGVDVVGAHEGLDVALGQALDNGHELLAHGVLEGAP
jgi:hypothetical protein